MKIAFLSPEYVTRTSAEGGLANYLKKTSSALSQKGCTVYIFVSSDRNSCWTDGDVTVYEVKKESRFLKSFTRIPVLNQFEPLLQQLFSLYRLSVQFKKAHRFRHFDLIQASSYLAPGFFLLKNKQVPLVCRVSSYTPLWRSAYGVRRTFVQYLSDWLEIRQVIDADSSFAPSHFAAKVFERMESHPMPVIRTMVETKDVDHDFEWFTANRPATPYLLYFGALNGIKGTDLLAGALPRILENHSDISFVCVGRDDSLPQGIKIFDHIRNACKKSADRLFYFPSQQKQRLYPFIANAEAVIMPSRVDNYPNACLEAQMFGRPVIGTNESSLEEMIIDGQTGFLAENSSPWSLTQAMEKFLRMSNAEKQEMTNNILETIRKVKAEDRIGKLIRYYQSVISQFKSQQK